MSENRNSMSGVTKVILVLALIIVVWNLYTGVKIQEVGIPGLFTIKFGDRNETPAPTPAVALTVTPTKTPAPPTHTPPPTPTRLPTETPVPKPSLIKENYLVDNRQNWIIVVTQLGDTSYRIEDPGSPWPWEGTATIDGGKLSGEARFRNSLATMRVEGIVRGDGTIEIEYKFITDGKGNPSERRIDPHTWYPTK